MTLIHKQVLDIDCAKETERICSFIEEQTYVMKRDGIVVGLSGGIDSSLAVELCTKAIGSENVFGLILPEKESNPVSRKYAQKHAEKLDIAIDEVDITSVLEGFGTYRRRDEIIKQLFPEYNDDYKFKIALPPDLLSKDTFNFFTITIDDGAGNEKSARLNKNTLNSIVAATNTKQRTRMVHLYYYAEKKNCLVCGTTNRSEVIQGFFVKYGDGGVDIEPLAHLYKTQVYRLSEYHEVIREIINRLPSPDTFSYDVSDEEFYFRMPYTQLDLLLYAWENNVGAQETSEAMDLTEEQVKRAFRDFSSKYNATIHLRQPPPALPVDFKRRKKD